MPNPYPFELSVGGVVKESGDLTFTDSGNQPGGGSLPDPVTVAVNIAPTNNTIGDLETVIAPTGYAGSSLSGNMLRLSDGVTDIHLFDVYGDYTLTAPTGDNGEIRVQSVDSTPNTQLKAGPGGTKLVINGTAGIAFEFDANADATVKASFFGVSPTTQPAAPVTLDDVIAALQVLGLVGT